MRQLFEGDVRGAYDGIVVQRVRSLCARLESLAISIKRLLVIGFTLNGARGPAGLTADDLQSISDSVQTTIWIFFWICAYDMMCKIKTSNEALFCRIYTYFMYTYSIIITIRDIFSLVEVPI